MKNQLKILLFLIFCSINIQCVSQEEEPKLEIISDYFYDISFEKYGVDLTDSDKETLMIIGDLIINNKSDNEYHFSIVPNIEEAKKSKFISFKRAAVILEFLKDKFKLEESKFTFKFHEAIPVDGIIRFSVR